MQPKPDWATKPEAVPFDLINKPLKEISGAFLNLLEREKREPSLYWFLLRTLLQTSRDTYLAIVTLVRTDATTKFPAQAHVLVRTLFEALANVLCLCEKPKEHADMFWKDGYRLMAVRFKREQTRYGQDRDWKGYLEELEQYLAKWAKELQLTKEQIENPNKNIPWWPTPGKMFKNTPAYVVKERAEFLKEIYDWWYGDASSQAHQQFLGIALGMYAKEPKKQWHPGKLESDAVANAAIFLACITSEIDVAGEYGRSRQLREVWTYLGSYFLSAKELYDFRFKKILPQ